MSRRLPPLLATRYFEAAARHLSFTLAAEELFVTQGAISLQIRKLEEFLGAPLFIRHARGIELTGPGVQFYEACHTLLDGLEKAMRDMTRPDHQQTLTVSTIPTIGTLWLMPRLASFTSMHPDIEVRVVSDIRPADMHSDNIDIALRAGKLPGQRYPANCPSVDLVMLEKWTDIEADLLFHDVMVPVASKEWYASQPPIHHARDFSAAALVHTASRPNAWPEWLKAYGVDYTPTGQEPEYGHFYISLRAAQDHKGIALIPGVLLQGYPGRNELEVLLPNIEPIRSAGDYYLLQRTSSRKRDAMQKFRDWVLAEAQNTPSH
ncbi:LysR substrate-binding domain-containing protein [Pollutimonas sp. M17]|uniref:LysR substrate-binding domain-containing protein n=1 Tax=Pollutimonas sp. M17 TaxID=2962065 RepID=UPI0021F44D4C|nr:LysR substrate-binding domain-containing protein [Pollutimonas sp. M17]UYO94013.1 LysR substrate-binding domain-containing protein [Pollutimonas sp. M17]